MTRGRALSPIDERMAQRYAATLTRPGNAGELGFAITAYMNEITGVIHLCREPQVSICGKQSWKRKHGDDRLRLRLNVPNEWSHMDLVGTDKFQLICTNCARRVWRQHQAIVAARG